MQPAWREPVYGQFGAALDMLANAIEACPDSLWRDRARNPQFWYVAYHTLFFTDFYLTETDEGFAPPTPFTLSELDPTGVLPDRVYEKAELLRYLAHGRSRLRARLDSLDEARAAERCRFERRDLSELELMLYNLRHVQHHAAQLNLLLRQVVDTAPGWVSRGGAG